MCNRDGVVCNRDGVVCNRDRVVCNRDRMYLSVSVQFKLGMSLMKLSFSLESWEACGGDADMSRQEAVQEARRHIESALQIFLEVCQSRLFVIVIGCSVMFGRALLALLPLFVVYVHM